MSFNRAGLVVFALFAVLSACAGEPEQVRVKAPEPEQVEKAKQVGDSPTMRTAHERATLTRANRATWNRAVWDAHAGGIVAARALVEREEESEPRTSPSSRSATSSPSGGVWDDLAACESGGNWSINTGTYDGGLQFLDATWDAMGGEQYAPTADLATKGQQIEVAQRLQAEAGWGQWPTCARKLGLR